jgi:ClpP class serine protease
MPSWGEVLKELQETNVESSLDIIRHKYLKIMHKYTGRNIIAYYSGFLQRSEGKTAIDDNDKNAFMQTVHGLDKNLGLDLILHTPGGEIAATESIVNYLKSIFGKDIRVFVPQIAMSAGTMIALSSKEIIMGKQSNIGPILFLISF